MRKARRHLPKPKSKPNRKIAIIAVFGFIVLLMGLIYHFLPSKWDLKSRIILAIPTKTGDVTVSIFDPQSHSIMYFSLPASMQVNASGNLGSWKLGSIWQLGIQEKKGGKLLTQTLLKSLHIPADAWASQEAIGLLSKNIGNIARAGIKIKDTNLSFKDRINITLFSLRLHPSDKYEINLVDSGYIYETRLLDGEEGYTHKKVLPSKILSYVSDPAIASGQLRVAISDSSGPSNAAGQITEVVESLGGKVLSIEDEAETQSDCLIHTTKPDIADKIADLLGCNITNQKPTGNFDIEIVIGNSFVRRF